MKNNIFWILCFILILPVLVLPPQFQPSDWTRAMLFRATVAVLVLFVLFKLLYKKDIALSFPKWNLVAFLPFLALSGFFIASIISTALSTDVRFSLFGSPARAGGTITFIFYFVFAVLITIFVKEEGWKKLFNVLFFTGILSSLLAFVQYFGFLGGIFKGYETGNTPSFLGNSTFLAIFMLFLSIFSFVILLQKIKESAPLKIKITYAALFCLFVFTILISGSRASYLALAGGFLYFFLFFPDVLKSKKLIRYVKVLITGVLLLVIVSIAYANLTPQLPSFIENNATLSYLIQNRLSIETIIHDLTGTRFSVWQMTWQAIKDKPWFGLGPENFYIGFEKYYAPVVSDLQKTWWDRPHNIFLDIWSSMGVFALTFYVAFWLLLFWGLQKFKTSEAAKEKPTLQLAAHGLQTMFLAYLTVLFFNFDAFSTYLISFFFIGYAFYLISENMEKIKVLPPKTTFFQNKPVALFFLIIVLAFVWFWGLKPLYLNESIVHAKNLSITKSCVRAISIMESAQKSPGILSGYAPLIYSDILKNCSAPEKETEYAQKGLGALKKASVIQPTWTRTWIFMGGFTNVLAAKEENAQKKSELLNQAKKYFAKAIELSPNRQEILIELEKTYLIEQDYTTMTSIAKDCIKIYDDNGACYWYLGVAEIFLGDIENGEKHIQIAEEHKDVTYSYIQLAAAYLSQNNYPGAKRAYEELVTSHANNASYHAVLAFLYKELGDYESAGIEAAKVFELQPNNQESVDFLQALLGLSPNSPSLHISMASIYMNSDRQELAQKELETAKNISLQLIATYPNKPMYRLYLADVYRWQENYDQAYQEALLAKDAASKIGDTKTRDRAEAFLLHSMPEEYARLYRKLINNPE